MIKALYISIGPKIKLIEPKCLTSGPKILVLSPILIHGGPKSQTSGPKCRVTKFIVTKKTFCISIASNFHFFQFHVFPFVHCN